MCRAVATRSLVQRRCGQVHVHDARQRAVEVADERCGAQFVDRAAATEQAEALERFGGELEQHVAVAHHDVATAEAHPQRRETQPAKVGIDGLMVSNHGGRQLDGVLSSARALPAIADAVKGDLKILVDSGVRNGLDVVRAISLGADAVLLGRAFIYALAANGQAGVENLLDLFEKEMRVAMTLTGAKSVAGMTR